MRYSLNKKRIIFKTRIFLIIGSYAEVYNRLNIPHITPIDEIISIRDCDAKAEQDALNKLLEKKGDGSLELFKRMWIDWVSEGCVPVSEKPASFKAPIAAKKPMTESRKENKPTTNEQKTEQLQEVRHQHPHFRDIMKLIMANTTNQLLHEKPILNFGQHADFAVVKKERPDYAPEFCMFVIELQLGPLDNTHKGKVIMYNRYILDTRPTRVFIVSVLTNLTELILIKTERAKDGFSVSMSSPIEFWSDGLL